MLISVTQAGKGIFHFTGDLDAYNLELLRDYAARFEKAPDAELRIKVEEYEEAAFRDRAKEWLSALVDAGVSVRVERIRLNVANYRRAAAGAVNSREAALASRPSQPRLAALTVQPQG